MAMTLPTSERARGDKEARHETLSLPQKPVGDEKDLGGIMDITYPEIEGLF